MLGVDARKCVVDGERAEIETNLQAHIEAVNAKLDPHEAMAFFAVVRDEWQIDNGFLTPTMKIKRGVIEQAYASEVEGWYAAKKLVVWQS